MKDFKKYYTIPATPEEVYLALTNPLSLRRWTGEDAVMSEVPGSRFSLWDGSITGENISFEYAKEFVQHWDMGDQEVPSVVTIRLHEHKKGTSLEIKHTNIPDELYNEYAEGWDIYYVDGLLEFFE